MNQLKCIAIDDEPLALRKVVDYIEKIPFLELVAQFDNGLEALAYLKQHNVDLIYLDIQMPDIKGTQLVSILKNKPQVVFTTAYDQYALEGYQLDATDYLLKPIAFDRFLESAQKALDRMAFVPTISENETEQNEGFLFVKTENKWRKVVINDILYIEGLKDYLSIYTTTERILTLQNFNSLLEKLSNDQFVRVHKSFVVAITQIQELEKSRVFINEKWIPVSDTYRTAFFNLLKAKGLM
ncbi:MAG: LytTR family DNA-binding domain-containing protein [bacterium]|nr:LytTR family DNA-binding domain-containing protein [bacterium]